MINNSANKLYIGISKNPEERVAYHNSKQGARFTASTSLSTGKSDYEIVFLEQYQTLSEARRREIQIKKWRREKKDNLVNRYQQGLPTKI